MKGTMAGSLEEFISNNWEREDENFVNQNYGVLWIHDIK